MNIHDATENAYRNGYQKGRADAAKEIFAEVDKITCKYLNNKDYSAGEMTYDLEQFMQKFMQHT